MIYILGLFIAFIFGLVIGLSNDDDYEIPSMTSQEIIENQQPRSTDD